MGVIFNKENILNEVYFGKTKELQKIENQLGIFRSKYMNHFVFNTTVNSDKELLKFNRMMEDFFGFGIFSLTIVNQPMINAYTLPIDFRIDTNTNANLIVDENRFKFNKEADYCCMVYIYSGIIFNEHYTTEECMAIIMHEVGHNFFGCLNSKNTPLVGIYKAILWLNIFYGNISILINPSTNNFSAKLIKTIERELRENDSLFISLHDIINQMGDVASTIMGAAFTIVNFLSFNTLKFALALLSKALNLFRTARDPISIIISLLMFPTNYRNERLADNFATMYGYGDSLSSALRKMEEHKSSPSEIVNNFHKIPFVAPLYNLNALIPSIVLTALDEHPQHIARIKDQLDMLEYESAKNNIDPKMRKAIQADIAIIEKEMQKYIKTTDGIRDPDLAKHLYNRFLYKHTNSKALKDLILDDRNKFEEYDKMFQSKIDYDK